MLYKWVFVTIKKTLGDFPGVPLVKSLCSQRRAHGFDPWLQKFHVTRGMAKKKKKDFRAFDNFERQTEYKGGNNKVQRFGIKSWTVFPFLLKDLLASSKLFLTM